MRAQQDSMNLVLPVNLRQSLRYKSLAQPTLTSVRRIRGGAANLGGAWTVRQIYGGYRIRLYCAYKGYGL